MSTAFIDRFEGDRAVLIIDGAEQVVRRDELPKGAREGDAIDLATCTVDEEATRARREESARLREKAFAGKHVKGSTKL